MILTESNYFSVEANREYVSVSQYKDFLKCEKMALAKLNGEWNQDMTTSLLVGSYVDAAFEGTLGLFKSKHPELFKKDGTLKAEYVKAEEIVQRCERDNLFMDYMSGDKQVIMTGVIAGVPIKIKIDSLSKDKIVDLKCMKDFKPIWNDVAGQKVAWFEAWKYDLQGAIYQEIVRQNVGEKLPFFLAAVTKENEPDLELIHIDDGALKIELQMFEANIPKIQAIKDGIIPAESCGKCDYCKHYKELTAPIESTDYNEDIDFEEE